MSEELARSYGHPGTFEEPALVRLPDGELVELTLGREEHGAPDLCHQAPIRRLGDGRACSDTASGGGRWPAPLVAGMAAAQAH